MYTLNHRDIALLKKGTVTFYENRVKYSVPMDSALEHGVSYLLSEELVVIKEDTIRTILGELWIAKSVHKYGKRFWEKKSVVITWRPMASVVPAEFEETLSRVLEAQQT